MTQLHDADHRIHFLDVGEGEPVVFLHNGGMSHEIWRPQIEHFRSSRRVIAPDLLGFGRSSKPDVDYALPLYVDMLERLVDELGLERFALVGNCVGAALALRYGTLHPHRVEAVVALNVDTDHTLEGGSFGGAYRVSQRVPGARRAFVWASRSLPVPQWMVQRGARSQYRGDYDEELAAYVRGLYRDRAQLRVLTSIMLNLHTYALIERPEGAEPPVCLVWGECNNVLPLRGMEAVREAVKPAEVHVIEGAGHLTARERPGEVNAIVERFLSPSRHRP